MSMDVGFHMEVVMIKKTTMFGVWWKSISVKFAIMHDRRVCIWQRTDYEMEWQSYFFVHES